MKKRSECTCRCHREPGTRHVVACCQDDDKFEDDELSFSVQVNNDIPTPEQIIGQSEEIVIDLIRKVGMNYRVSKRDDESFIGTDDFVPERFNLTIENGIVTNVAIG